MSISSSLEFMDDEGERVWEYLDYFVAGQQ